MVVFELESGPPDCEFDYLSFETKDPGRFSRGFWFALAASWLALELITSVNLKTNLRIERMVAVAK